MEIHVQMKLQGDGFLIRAELTTRNKIEDLIMERQIGEIVDAGAGLGVADIYIEVEDVEPAIQAVHHLLNELQLQDITTIKRVESS